MRRAAIHMIGTWGFTTGNPRQSSGRYLNTLLAGESTTRQHRPSNLLGLFLRLLFHVRALYGATANALGRLLTAPCRLEDAGGENPCNREWGSFHPGTLNFVFCDGAVHPLSTNIDPTLFCNLATIDGQ